MNLDYSEISERMLRAGGIMNSSQLARVLGVTPQALSNYKKRGGLPTSLLFKFAAIYEVSVDWLITGEGEIFRAAEQDAPYSGNASIELTGFTDEETTYIGKLLDVLRHSEETVVRAVKSSIDAFLDASYPEKK
ncbi:MAG: helix-turn-helix domain-containing protein [Thermodesulfobacteriota bacterium]